MIHLEDPLELDADACRFQTLAVARLRKGLVAFHTTTRNPPAASVGLIDGQPFAKVWRVAKGIPDDGQCELDALKHATIVVGLLLFGGFRWLLLLLLLLLSAIYESLQEQIAIVGFHLGFFFDDSFF